MSNIINYEELLRLGEVEKNEYISALGSDIYNSKQMAAFRTAAVEIENSANAVELRTIDDEETANHVLSLIRLEKSNIEEYFSIPAAFAHEVHRCITGHRADAMKPLSDAATILDNKKRALRQLIAKQEEERIAKERAKQAAERARLMELERKEQEKLEALKKQGDEELRPAVAEKLEAKTEAKIEAIQEKINQTYLMPQAAVNVPTENDCQINNLGEFLINFLHPLKLTDLDKQELLTMYNKDEVARFSVMLATLIAIRSASTLNLPVDCLKVDGVALKRAVKSFKSSKYPGCTVVSVVKTRGKLS